MKVSALFFISAMVAAMAYFQADGPASSPVPGPGSDIAAMGQESLIFAVAPKSRSAPVMPDIPWELPDVAPDSLPTVGDAASSRPIKLTSAEFLAAQTDDVPLQSRTVPADPALRRVTALSLNLRSGPSSRFPAITALRKGDRAVISGRARGGWVPVRLVDSDRRGWVFQRYLAPVHS